ncbi:MAG: adenylate/guanylate cyclase domain-containing protein [Sedimentitalea sp.]
MPDTSLTHQSARLFREAEIRAEGLVALMRMGVALGLTLVFAIAMSSDSVPETQVLARQSFYAMLTVGSYFVLGAVSLTIVRTGNYALWMVWVAATGDCVFVLASIWLGLHNTGLTPQFIFVFPAIWLMPLVLAFGALRFDPWVQGYIALVLIVGLVLLNWFGPKTIGPYDRETAHLFFAGPPNLMRMAMILLASVVLVVASIRARRILLRSLTESMRSSNLTRYLPAQLAPRLAQGGLEDLRTGRREDMAILFVDMRGFTTLSETMAPGDLSSLVTNYRARITAAAQATGGMIDKFMGDAALVVFEDETDKRKAARACLTCAERINWDIADWSATREAAGEAAIRIGIGVHWGSVFCGVVGHDDRLEYSVFGDAVNTAARLEEMTKATGARIIASRALLDCAGLGKSPAGWVALSTTQVRGRSGLIEIMGKTDPVS